MARRADLVLGRGGHDRLRLRRVRRAADRRASAPNAQGRGLLVLDRRPLRHRHPLPRRRGADRQAGLGRHRRRHRHDAARPRDRRRALARDVARAPARQRAVAPRLVPSSATGRVLAPRLGVRGLRGRGGTGLRRGRLDRRIHRRGAAAPGGAAGSAERPDRPLGAQAPAPRQARATHRLPPEVPALVGPSPPRRRHRHHGRAHAARLDRRSRSPSAVLRDAPGPLGGGARLAAARDARP